MELEADNHSTGLCVCVFSGQKLAYIKVDIQWGLSSITDGTD